jgi:predicted nucleic acid-binding protein
MRKKCKKVNISAWKNHISQGNVNSLDGVAIEALMIFVDKNIDFVDALLCAYSKNDEVRTFDKKLLKCIANR